MRKHKKNNKNFYVTKVRAEHNCRFCKGIIHIGEESLTINPKKEGRFWICRGCYLKIFNYKRAVSEANSVAFGDEGAEYAYQDYLSDLYDELYTICADEELLDRFGIKD